MSSQFRFGISAAINPRNFVWIFLGMVTGAMYGYVSTEEAERSERVDRICSNAIFGGVVMSLLADLLSYSSTLRKSQTDRRL